MSEPPAAEQDRPADVTWHPSALTRDERWRALGAPGGTVWLTGLPASGKSTIAVAVEKRLVEAGRPAYLLDGDNLRHGISADLGFSAQARSEQVRRTGHLARLMADAGLLALVSLVSPYREDRDRVREIHDEDGLTFLEVFVNTPLEECERRDPKGLFARARRGELTGFTGVDDPYEPPAQAELELRPAERSLEQTVEALLELLRGRGLVDPHK